MKKYYEAFRLISYIFLTYLAFTLIVWGILRKLAVPPAYSLAAGYIIPLAGTIWATLRKFGFRLYFYWQLPPPRILALILLFYFLYMIPVEMLTSFLPPPGPALQFLVDYIRNHPVSAFIVIVIAAPVLEELLFRRILLHFLLTKYPPATAIILSALAFGLIHLNIWQGISGFLLALYFGYVYWRTYSYPVVVGLHMLTNLWGYTVAFTTGDLSTGNENLPVFMRILVASAFLLMVVAGFPWLDRRLRRCGRILLLASHNPHKAAEIKALLPPHFRLFTLRDVGYRHPLSETGETLEENSLQKARQIASVYGFDTLADDTGLEVEALHGQPGVRSARFAGENATDAHNRQLLLQKLYNTPNRRARFRTVLTWLEGNRVHTFEGRIDGRIAEQEAGTSGFGYDPIFIPEGHNRTFAQMTSAEKNRISHRARALQRFTQYLRNRFNV